MHELADDVVISRSGLTRLADRLETDGLIERCTAPATGEGSSSRSYPRGRHAPPAVGGLLPVIAEPFAANVTRARRVVEQLEPVSRRSASPAAGMSEALDSPAVRRPVRPAAAPPDRERCWSASSPARDPTRRRRHVGAVPARAQGRMAKEDGALRALGDPSRSGSSGSRRRSSRRSTPITANPPSTTPCSTGSSARRVTTSTAVSTPRYSRATTASASTSGPAATSRSRAAPGTMRGRSTRPSRRRPSPAATSCGTSPAS